MSNSSDNNGNSLDLSGLSFGPAWVRDEAKPKDYSSYEAKEDRPRPKRGGRNNGGFQGGGNNRDRGGRNDRRPRDGKNFRRDDRRGERRFEPVAAPEGFTGEVMPIEEGLDRLAKQILQTARTYSVFQLARLVLQSRERFNVGLKAPKGQKLFRNNVTSASFLTKEEAMADFWTSEAKPKYYQEVKKEVEAPSGNFTKVAKCSKSGVYVGPPNHHSYQSKLRELHRERFSFLPFESFQRQVIVEEGEESVNAWIEQEKFQTYYAPVSELPAPVEGEEAPEVDENLLIKTRAELERHFLDNYFAQVYKQVPISWVPSSINKKLLSPGLFTLLKDTISEERRYPGKLASLMCRQLSGRSVAVFKINKKLNAGPSRPHVLPAIETLSDKPKVLLQWALDNDGKGVDELWKDVLPADVSEDDKASWFHDFKWLLTQGFVTLFEDGQVFYSKKVETNEQPKKAEAPAKEETEPAPAAETPEALEEETPSEE